MSSVGHDSAAAASNKEGSDHPYSQATFTGSHASSSHSSSIENRTRHHHDSHSSHRSAHVKSASASTPSSDTLRRPHERSMTATGRSSSPLDAPLQGSEKLFTVSHNLSNHAPPHLSAAAPAPAVSGAPPDVRDTVEYRAAWDLELWKAVQADRFRKQLEKQKSVAEADLAHAVRQREKTLKEELSQRTQAVAAREAAVHAAEAQLAARQSKAVEAEREVRRMRQQLLDAQQRVEDEVRAQVRLANDTIAHRARLLEERVKAAEGQAKRAEERQRQSQEEYLALYEAFSRYRTQQLTTPPGFTNGGVNGQGLLAVSSTAGTSSSLGAAYQLDQLRAQWDTERQLQLERQEQRHRTETAALQEKCRDLEEQNRRLTAALARRREQLRHLRAEGKGRGADVEGAAPIASPPPQLKDKGSAGVDAAPLLPSNLLVRGGAGGSAAPLSQRAVDPAVREAVEKLMRELHRLEADRVSLVDGSCGAVRETDAVIVRMDARVRELQSQLAALQGTTPGFSGGESAAVSKA